MIVDDLLGGYELGYAAVPVKVWSHNGADFFCFVFASSTELM